LIETTMKVNASSAIATLTISDATLKDDPLFQLVIGAASPLQLTVKSPKKAKLGLELINGVMLTQRNSIIRCLCGMGLHNALDGSPFYFYGGYATSSSATRSVSLASLTSWMSLADEVKKGNDSTLEELLMQLNSHLTTRSYLIDSPSITIADVDLAAVLGRSTLFDEVASYPNIHRWYCTVQETLKVDYGISLSPKLTSIDSHVAPVFFYGNETNIVIPKTTVVATTGNIKLGIPKTKNAEKSQQQQQQTKTKKKAAKTSSGKKQQQPKAAAAPTIDALDIRVGKIVKAWHHPESSKLFCEEIDVGEDTPRQIASGLRLFYETSQLEGRKVMVLCNLKSRKLAGFASHGMVLCASNEDHTVVECMVPPDDAQIGTRVTFDGYEGDPEPENKIAKKKIFEKIAPDLKTDANGVCVWKGAVSKPIVKGMPDSHVS